ncbi:MAG: HNH endonuclease [Armatimonadetes bacterium]|nr:HNH endonuclease [Armatimonadota bacterium]
MEGEVLVLNSDYEPLNVCNMRRAVVLVYMGKAEVLHEGGKPIRHSGATMLSPSVVKLRHRVRRPLPELKLSRRSIFARDNYTCQYCGQSARELTIDHVVPKRLGGSLEWDNLVASCKRCNSKKGDKTLQQSGMILLKLPKRPRYVPYISLTKYVSGSKNETWRMYLPSFDEK